MIKFGTDGWRAAIADEYTFDNVRLCAASVARYLKRHRLASRGLVVGYDARFASEDFAAAVAEVCAAQGIRVALSKTLCPTPVVSHAIIDRKAGGGVVITASHNPWRDNGFKYKPDYGGSASPEIVAEIEAALPGLAKQPVRSMPIAGARAKGLVVDFDPRGPYLRRLRRLVDVERLRSRGLRVAYDAMYGTGAGYLSELIGGDATQVFELHGFRNPVFPGMHAPEPIARNLAEVQQLMRGGGFDAGIATDGDADRVGVLDERGEFIHQLHVFGLLIYYLLEYRKLRGPIVKSVTTTSMANRLGELYGVPVHETQVGFKYLGPKMMATNALIGGEESGGYGFRGHVPERDGILAGLYMLDFLAAAGKTPSALLRELFDRVGEHHYDRIDIRLKGEAERRAILSRAGKLRPKTIAGVDVTARDTTDGFRFLFGDRGWLLFRFSGTEPLLRIYSEMRGSPALVRRVLREARSLLDV